MRVEKSIKLIASSKNLDWLYIMTKTEKRSATKDLSKKDFCKLLSNLFWTKGGKRKLQNRSRF